MMITARAHFTLNIDFDHEHLLFLCLLALHLSSNIPDKSAPTEARLHITPITLPDGDYMLQHLLGRRRGDVASCTCTPPRLVVHDDYENCLDITTLFEP